MQLSQTLALALALAVDAVGVAGAIWVARRGKLAPMRARMLIVLGLLVGGLGLATATLAPWMADVSQPALGGWSSAWWQWATATLGLLLVGAGAERLAAVPPRSRRHVRVAEGAALTLSILGVATAATVAAGAIPAEWTAGGRTIPVATAGWACALAGAAGVVAANASGRFTGLVPHGRRLALGLAAVTVAMGAATGPLVGAWLAGTASLPQMELAFDQVWEGAGLALLAWSAQRALNRPRAADYWRPALATRRQVSHRAAAPLRTTTSQPPRVKASVPATGDAAAPALSIPLALASSMGPAVPFTPPVLRRSVLLDGDPVSIFSRPTLSPSPVAGPLAALSPAAPITDTDITGSAARTTGEALFERERSEHGAPGSATDRVSPLVEGPHVDKASAPGPLSPQFVAALIRLQTEMARVGRSYEFAELVELFSDVRPRIAALGWTNAGDDLEPLASAPPVAAPLPPTIATAGASGSAFNAARPSDEPRPPRRSPHFLP